MGKNRRPSKGFTYFWISGSDIELFDVSLLGLTTILFLGVFYKELLAITFDEESAKLTGADHQRY